MSRKHRIEIADIPYHLIVRGNNRGDIFIDNDCYVRYLELLQGYKHIHNYKLYCYCLMPNHIHLILMASEKSPISKIMQCINTSYTIYVNKKFKRTGHVMEGRYKSKIINDNDYLLHLSRYIHLNPVKAGLSSNPQDYKYSSARFYLVEKMQGGLVDTDFILHCLSDYKISAICEYKIFLESLYPEDSEFKEIEI